jgi:hypothetical protein
MTPRSPQPTAAVRSASSYVDCGPCHQWQAGREARDAAAPLGALDQRELRAARTVLGYLAELDLLPKVREGELRRALKKVDAALKQPTFLRPAEIATLLQAALAHDAEVFDETRAEHRGEGERGSTERYEPVAPFVATLLLTGMRLGESASADLVPGRPAGTRPRRQARRRDPPRRRRHEDEARVRHRLGRQPADA